MLSVGVVFRTLIFIHINRATLRHRFMKLGKMSVLKSSMDLGFVLLSLICMSHAACWHGINKPGATHCQDFVDETWHEFGSSWKNSDCAKCWCNPEFVRCCHSWPTSVSSGCSIKHDYLKCTFKITNHVNPGSPCSAIGK